MHSYKTETPFQTVIYQNNYNNLMKLPRIKYSPIDDFLFDNSMCVEIHDAHSHLRPPSQHPLIEQ